MDQQIGLMRFHEEVEAKLPALVEAWVACKPHHRDLDRAPALLGISLYPKADGPYTWGARGTSRARLCVDAYRGVDRSGVSVQQLAVARAAIASAVETIHFTLAS